MTNLIGQSLGRYQILEQLGEGGMATVYKAYDTRLEANVAVKVIRTEHLAPDIAGRALKRFEREAKALARLTHPHIVKVSDYGEYEGQPYLVMPYLPGGNLKQRLKSYPLPWQEAIRLLEPIARALEYAHSMGVIHRDVKPSNILITQSGEPMLTDFGVAKVMEEKATVSLTGAAMTVGTPEYMAPEQAISKTVDHRADIYSLGMVLYEMVTGQKPFVADTPLAVLIKQASEPLPQPRQFVPTLPDKVEKIILKALAKKPGDRYQTMGEFAAALQQCLTERPSEQMMAKSVQADLIPARGEIVSERMVKARPWEETPPIDAWPYEAGTSGELSKPHAETVMGKKKSGKPSILIGCLVALAFILCMGSWICWDSTQGAAIFSLPTATSTQPPTATLLPIPMIPRTLSIITPNNASQIRQFARSDNGNPSYTVTSVAFSPDGITLASGSWDKTVKLWRVSDGKLLRTLEGHNLGVISVAFSPDGTVLATGSYDNTVKLWRVSDGVLLRTLEGHMWYVYSVAFSPDGTTLASGSYDETVKLWRASDGALLRTLKGHTWAVGSVAFSPDGSTLASGSWDKTVKLWRVSDGSLLRTLEGHTSYVYSVAFSPDGTTLASGSWDNTVKLWRVSDGALLHTMEGHNHGVNSVAFSPDGTMLVSGSDDNSLKLWRVADGVLLHTMEGHMDAVWSVAFSPDETTLASGSHDGTIRFWGVLP